MKIRLLVASWKPNTAVIGKFNMASYSISCFLRSFRSLVASCELISKGFLPFKVYYSSSSRWYLRKLKMLYFQGYHGSIPMARNKARAGTWKGGGKVFPWMPQECDEVVKILSKAFSTDDKQVEVKGREFREKMDRILEKTQNYSVRVLL